MNSYAKRKREIVYWKQRGEDLEAIIDVLLKQLTEAGIEPKLMLGSAIISGDRFINDITSGEFAMRHLSRR